MTPTMACAVPPRRISRPMTTRIGGVACLPDVEADQDDRRRPGRRRRRPPAHGRGRAAPGPTGSPMASSRPRARLARSHRRQSRCVSRCGTPSRSSTDLIVRSPHAEVLHRDRRSSRLVCRSQFSKADEPIAIGQRDRRIETRIVQREEADANCNADGDAQAPDQRQPRVLQQHPKRELRRRASDKAIASNHAAHALMASDATSRTSRPRASPSGVSMRAPPHVLGQGTSPCPAETTAGTTARPRASSTSRASSTTFTCGSRPSRAMRVRPTVSTASSRSSSASSARRPSAVASQYSRRSSVSGSAESGRA